MNTQLIGDLFAEATRRMTSGSSKEFSEKFALLIVKECCKIMADHPDRPAGVIKRNVKEHFGVEE